MSDSSTRRMIEMYMDEAEAPMFLSGFFQSPPRNFHNTEMVEIDIVRDDPDIAIVVTDLTVDGRENESTKYTNKGFTPPIFDEKGTITSYDLIKRRAGVDPFQDPNYAANAVEEAFRIFRKLERKIRRSIELMAAQVLQTGKVTLNDAAGVALYELDFIAKATHLATVGSDWSGLLSSTQPLTDVEDLADVVRQDGKQDPDRLTFGKKAWRNWINNSEVQKRLDKTTLALGQVAPQSRGKGATFQGFVWIGSYRFEMWTYNGFYKHPQTGAPTPYIDDDNLIMTSSGGRLDLSYGAIPMMRQPETAALAFLPPRMSDSASGLDLSVNAYFSTNGKHLKVEAGTRPLTIPTAIDTFARLNTNAP